MILERATAERTRTDRVAQQKFNPQEAIALQRDSDSWSAMAGKTVTQSYSAVPPSLPMTPFPSLSLARAPADGPLA
eukprot:4016267-Pleurochrysis_carterae.AAC.1